MGVIGRIDGCVCATKTAPTRVQRRKPEMSRSAFALIAAVATPPPPPGSCECMCGFAIAAA